MILEALRSLGRILVVWLLIAAVQTMLAQIAARTIELDPATVVYAVSMAICWAALTPLIASASRATERREVSVKVRIVALVIAIAVASIVDTAWRRLTLALLHIEVVVPFSVTMLYYADLTTAAVIAVVIVQRALDAEAYLTGQTRRELALRTQLAHAQLEHLETQLQPHFLFNALGTVAELAHETPAAAERMLRQLASLMRFTEQRTSHTLSLRDELDALEPYLEIQRVRFADWLVFERDVSNSALECLLPRFTLQPLVENAIRHGLAGRTTHGRICICGAIVDGRLCVSVRDNGVGLAPSNGTAGYGIGLRNLRNRLTVAYGDDFSLELFAAGDGGAVAEFCIPATTSPSATERAIDDFGPQRTAPRTTQLIENCRRHPIVAISAGWLLWGIVWFQISYSYLSVRHRLGQESLGSLIRAHLMAVILWGVLTPLVFRLAQALPLTENNAWQRVLIHVAGSCVFALMHTALWQLASTTTEPLWSPRYLADMLSSVLLYAILVGIAYYQQIIVWLRQRETANARLEADVAETQLRASTVRFKPALVMHALDDLAKTVLFDPIESERTLLLLAEQLRGSLDATFLRVM